MTIIVLNKTLTKVNITLKNMKYNIMFYDNIKDIEIEKIKLSDIFFIIDFDFEKEYYLKLIREIRLTKHYAVIKKLPIIVFSNIPLGDLISKNIDNLILVTDGVYFVNIGFLKEDLDNLLLTVTPLNSINNVKSIIKNTNFINNILLKRKHDLSNYFGSSIFLEGAFRFGDILNKDLFNIYMKEIYNIRNNNIDTELEQYIYLTKGENLIKSDNDIDNYNYSNLTLIELFKKLPQKILYLDDEYEKGWSYVLGNILYPDSEWVLNSTNNKKIVCFSNYDEILNCLTDCYINNFDIILLDLRINKEEDYKLILPEEIEQLSGIKILKEIRKINPYIPVIIFTASEKSYNFEESIKYNITGFFTKSQPNANSLQIIKNYSKFHFLIKKSHKIKYKILIWEILEDMRLNSGITKHEQYYLNKAFDIFYFSKTTSNLFLFPDAIINIGLFMESLEKRTKGKINRGEKYYFLRHKAAHFEEQNVLKEIDVILMFCFLFIELDSNRFSNKVDDLINNFLFWEETNYKISNNFKDYWLKKDYNSIIEKIKDEINFSNIESPERLDILEIFLFMSESTICCKNTNLKTLLVLKILDYYSNENEYLLRKKIFSIRKKNEKNNNFQLYNEWINNKNNKNIFNKIGKNEDSMVYEGYIEKIDNKYIYIDMGFDNKKCALLPIKNNKKEYKKGNFIKFNIDYISSPKYNEEINCYSIFIKIP